MPSPKKKNKKKSLKKEQKDLITKVHPTEVISPTSIQTTNILQQYMREVSKYPILSKEDEHKLTVLYYKTKDLNALKILVQSNLRFVVKVAGQYSKFGSKLIDLIQEGNIGLLKAINEFNPYKGVRLISYAVLWIRGAIQEYLMKQYSIVRIGTTPQQKKLFYLLRKENESHQLPKTPLLSNKLNIPEKEIESMRSRLQSKDVSIEYHDSDKQDPDQLEKDFEEKQNIELLKTSIRELKSKLSEKEHYILNHRVLSNEPHTLQEIGNHFNVTRESIRQIEARLIEKIKTHVQQYIKT